MSDVTTQQPHASTPAPQCLTCGVPLIPLSGLCPKCALDEVPPANSPGFQAPHPGTPAMPRWDAGELPVPPKMRWSDLLLSVGPGLVMAASAVGGGEWLLGPKVTAKYGGNLLWLASLSILFQTVYNVEISRYTLYTGEPIFTGKFRIPPRPLFWAILYLVFDFGSFLPYLASNAAQPLYAILFGRLANPNVDWDLWVLKGLSCCVFLGALIPLLIGGRIYNSLKVVTTFKLAYVGGFLVFLALFFSTPKTWIELSSGFFKFGNVPVISDQDTNKNGKEDPGEEPHVVKMDNLFSATFAGRPLMMDLSMVGLIMAMAAISGNGGLTNTPISNYTREQGWGMGRHVGAIPSIVGGHSVELSHVGMVFEVNEATLPRWKQWVKYIEREQFCVWLPACFLGLALPSMLSVQFLPRGQVTSDDWSAAVMTAGGVQSAVTTMFGTSVGSLFWYLTIFCGFLILSTCMVTTADGVLRRWVEVCWTASPQLRTWHSRYIGRLYFGVLAIYTLMGLCMLTVVNAKGMLVYSTMFYNYVLGVSFFHTIAVGRMLLPRELRPSWVREVIMALGGVFFLFIAVLTTYVEVQKMIIAAANDKSPPVITAPVEPTTTTPTKK